MPGSTNLGLSLQVVKGFVPVDKYGNFVSGGATPPPEMTIEGMPDAQREALAIAIPHSCMCLSHAKRVRKPTLPSWLQGPA